MIDFSLVTDAISNADSAIDLWYAVIAGLPALITAVAVFYGQTKARKRWTKQEKNTDAVLFEVQNDHDTNLRDDIDEIKTGIRTLHQTVNRLAEDLTVERRERIDGDKRKEG